MRVAIASFLVLVGLSQAAEASYLVNRDYRSSQPVVSLKLVVTDDTVDEAIESAFESIEEEMGEAALEAAGDAFFRILTEDETESYMVEVGYLVKIYPFSVPVHMRGALPSGLALDTLHEGSEDSTPAYEALEAYMAANRMVSAGMPWELYSEDDRVRVVWPVAQVGGGIPAPAP